MSTIPLDVQRRLEQRSAARFARPVAPKQKLERQGPQLAVPIEDEEKTRPVEPAGLRPVPAA